MAEQSPRPPSEQRQRQSQRAALGLLVLALVLTATIAIRTEPIVPDQSCCDGLYYRSMAYNLVRVTRPELNEPPPGITLDSAYGSPYYGQYYKRENKLNRQQPFVYRVVVPMLARALAALPQVDIAQAFHTISFLSVLATCWLLGLSVFDLSRDPLAATTAVATAALTYRITGFHLWYTTLVDPLALALIALGVWLMIRRMDRWIYAVVLVGAFTKETVFFLMAAHLVQLVVERRLRWPSLAAYGAIGASYLIFRQAVPIPIDAFTLANTYRGLPDLSSLAASTISAFGILAFFAASRVWFSRTALYLLPLPLGVLVSSMFTPDHLRLIVYVFPLVYVAVFAHRTQGIASRALLIAPGALFIGFRLLDEWFVDLTTIQWAIIYAATYLAFEPLFFASAGWLRPYVPIGRLRTG